MGKYIVKRELPGLKIGEEFKSTNPLALGFDIMIRDGWIEEVKVRKSLDDKLQESYPVSRVKDVVIAKQHYLELFDEAVKEEFEGKVRYQELHSLVERIRQKLEKG